MPPREMYVGRRPRRRGLGLIYAILFSFVALIAVGIGAGLYTLWHSPLLVGIARPAPTATPVPAPTATPSPVLVGTVIDAYTGAPLAGAPVTAGEQQVSTGPDGAFRLPRPAAAGFLRVALPDYEPVERPVGPGQEEPLRLALRPTRLEGLIRDSDGRPLAGARVSAGGPASLTDERGRFALTDVPANATVTVEAAEHAKHTEPVGRRTALEIQLRTSTLAGIVTARHGGPVARATVAIGEAQTTTGADGRFRLTNVTQGGTLAVKAGGYRAVRRSVQPGERLEISLDPLIVKAIYLTHLTAADDKRFGELLALVKRTELNAMVIDVKGESGHIFYDSKVPLAREIGAVDPAYDVRKRLRQLREANVYAIARQVIMEDTTLATARPEWAIRNKATGQPWKDVNGIGWLNPFRVEVWDYNIAIAREVAELGFDEVQFDYIRFPSDGRLDQIDYGRPHTEEARTAAIAGLLTKARTALAPAGVYFSADIFGLTTVAEDDMGIGQSIETIADAVDYLCPMVYPSHYARGSFGHPNPAAKPYEVVAQSLAAAKPRLGEGRAKLRPWLQDFDLYGTPYTPEMVRAQIKAAEEQQTSGWLIWNAGNRYQEAALRPGSA
jgi:hypothetical protein